MITAPPRVTEMTTVPVPLGARAYDILIGRGLLAELGKRIAALKPGASAAIVTDETIAARHLKPGASAAIVTDETIAARHLKPTEAALAAAGIRAAPIIVPPGEATKSWR